MEDYSKLSKKELLEKLQQAEQLNNISRLSTSDHEDEIAKIDRLSSVANPHQIPFREITDHKNVMLYTALNKRVGPLHPENARRTMIRWKKAGIQLYTSPRTPEQIEAFKQTDEYKQAKMKHDALRKSRRSQSTKGRQEKMIKEIAVAVAGARNNG